MSTINVGDRVEHKVSGLKGVVTHVLVEDGLAAVHYDLAQFAQTSIIEQLTLLDNEGQNWHVDSSGNVQITGSYKVGDRVVLQDGHTGTVTFVSEAPADQAVGIRFDADGKEYITHVKRLRRATLSEGLYIIEAQGESLEAQAFANGGTLFLDEAGCPDCGHETGTSNGMVVCDNCGWSDQTNVDLDYIDEAKRLARGHQMEYERGYNAGVNAALDAVIRYIDLDLRLTLRN